ncbi:MAG: YcbK family protein [Paracoccaceae bacterium]
MADSSGTTLSRRSLIGSVFAATAIAAAPTYTKAAGFLRGGGDVRRIRMFSGRTGERIDMIYWIEGRYIRDALAEVNAFMRDWRNGQVAAIDTRQIDIMAGAHNLLQTETPYMLISGYRSPQTNAMLRARSSGVARNSLHMQAKAADLRLQGRSVNQIARAAAACRGGGVGRYSGSNFVHMDCGNVRSWGS